MTKLTYDDPKTVQGIQFLHDLIWAHRVAPTANDQRRGMTREEAFLNGRVSIYFNASINAGVLRQRGAATGLDWDLLPLVKGPGGYGGRASVGG